MSESGESPAQHGVRLVVAYDGTDFHGFQLQAPGLRSVQGVLEEAVERMTRHPVRVRGAGRTDAGVHALGQVVAFDSARAISERGWTLGLNTYLPDDVRVQRAEACAPGYNPRFDAIGKHYRYLVQFGEAKDPLLRNRAWQLGSPKHLDRSAMRAAAKLLTGRHDYRAFRASDDQRPGSERTLWSIELRDSWNDCPTLLAIDVRGNAFMKHMVRILSGTLVDVGFGRIPLDQVPRMLGAEADRTHAGQTAPAHGLTLVSVELGRSSLTYDPR
ncbi:MAG TPA: tRNA pseudouridine(38-40) synthase TruA [Polyangiales bacterium]